MLSKSTKHDPHYFFNTSQEPFIPHPLPSSLSPLKHKISHDDDDDDDGEK